MNTLHETEQRSAPNITKWGYLVAILLLLGGLGFSVELLYIHYKTHTDLSFNTVCSVSQAINCQTVARSKFAVVAQLPVASWGLIAYGLLLAMVVVAWRQPLEKQRRYLGALTFAAAGSVLVAGVLAYISHVFIGSLCPYCAALYGVNFLLLGTFAVMAVRLRANPLKQMWLFMQGWRVFLAWAGVGAVLLALSYALTPPYWIDAGWQNMPRFASGVTAHDDHWIGAETPVMTVIEYSDYQCPYCRRVHKQVRLDMAPYHDKIRLVHRHYPVDHHCNPDVKRPYHDRACEFAYAAHCAGVQGRFWEMNDRLYSILDYVAVADVDLEQLAGKIGLDVPLFTACRQSETAAEIVADDLKSGKRRGVPGTPTYYINQQPFIGGINSATLKKWLQHAEKKAAKAAKP